MWTYWPVYSTYIYTHMYVYIWVGRGVWALLFNTQLLRTINCHCSLLQFAVYLLQRKFLLMALRRRAYPPSSPHWGSTDPKPEECPLQYGPTASMEERYLYIYTYINTCGHTDQYYSIYIYTHVHVYILGGEGCGGIATQLLHCSLPHFAVYILQRHFCWWHYGGAHIHPAVHTGAARTPSPRSAHYSMAQPLLWKRGVITYEQPIHIAITACHHVIEPQHFQFYIGRLIADINTKITSSVTLVPTQGIFFFQFYFIYKHKGTKALLLHCATTVRFCIFPFMQSHSLLLNTRIMKV